MRMSRHRSPVRCASRPGSEVFCSSLCVWPRLSGAIGVGGECQLLGNGLVVVRWVQVGCWRFKQSGGEEV
jgi:hypothetical protein